MTCRDMNGILISAHTGAELSAEARQHIQTCAECRALVSSVNSTDAPYAVDTALLERIRGSVLSSAAPVRPLAPTAVFALAFVVIFGAIAYAGALRLGIHGLPVLTVIQRIAIFTVLLALAVLAAFTAARSMRPGARTLSGGIVFIIALIVEEAVFFSVFHDYRVGRFLHWGAGCLRSGLLCAIPAALLIWLLARRGYILAPISTGAAIGALAGMAGLTALELHCPIRTIPHVAIWHVGVLIISVAVGALIGWLARLRSSHSS
jgi:hypothetical protein